MRPLRKALSFVEERTGLRALWRAALDEQVEGGASWAHVFGSSLLVLFLVQAATGVLLALTYTPAVDDAWSSVFYIEEKVVNGWFLRGLHSYGGQAMLIVASLHVVQVVLYGAYKKPRELSWWLSLAALGLILVLLITGMRLPWDQRTYWALLVEWNITAATPVVGEAAQTLIAGGPSLGQATLTRLYAGHAIVLPLILVLVLFVLRALRRRNGLGAAPWGKTAAPSPAFPAQTARDVAFVLLVLAVVSLLTIDGHGADLDAPAEPFRYYPARPEWFLLPLYELRMLLPADLETVATLVLPGLVAALLFGLPFLDRGEGGGLRRRVPWLLGVLLLFGGAGALVANSRAKDAADEEYLEARAEADVRAARSIALARSGVPPGGPIEMLRNDPMTHGRDLYRQYCASCHVLDGEGEREAPDHTGFGSRQWNYNVMVAPQDEHLFGSIDLEEDMESMADELEEEELLEIAELMFALGREPQDPEIDAEKAARGRAHFERKCMSCHWFEGDGDFMGIGGPNLTLYGSRTWIFRQIAHPQAATQYGTLNDMPPFADQLSDHDIRMVTAYLRLQRFEAPDYEVTPPE